MKFYPFSILVILFIILSTSKLIGQRDTIFWFAAPEVAQGNIDYDRPVAFQISSYERPVEVEISQPANLSFTNRIVNLPANSTITVEFPPDFQFVENNIENTIRNIGFRIKSNHDISVYYEVIGGCECNPEIFSLKGNNALGELFYVPFQTYLPNSTQSNHTPSPYAAFDIIATENNTIVIIEPSMDIVGHSANTPIILNLQMGQTWSGRALTHLALDRPIGTEIISNKPIAVTMKDDLLNIDGVYFGTCRDLIGDQLIPERNFGYEFILHKGGIAGIEKAFFVSSVNNNTIQVNGNVQSVINKGDHFILDLSNDIYYIQSSEPLICLQVSGVGCELSAAIIPSLECNGNNSIRFMRSTSEPMYLTIITETANIGNFLVNNINQIITANEFTPVPGTNGKYRAARIFVDEFTLPPNQSIEIKNTSGTFQLGYLNGNPEVTGTRFAYFSDFGQYLRVNENITICQGDTVYFNDKTYTEPGRYTDTIISMMACDTILIIDIIEDGLVELDSTFIECIGKEFTIGDTTIVNSGEYEIYLNNDSTCDSLIHLSIEFIDIEQDFVEIDNCEGETIQFGNLTINKDTVIIDTSYSMGICGTATTYTFNFSPLNVDSIEVFLCPGDSIILSNQTIINSPGIYIDTISSISGCDTLLNIDVQPNDLIEKTVLFTICENDTVFFHDQFYTENGIYQYSVEGDETCDTIFTIEVNLVDQIVDNIDIYLCQGDSLTLNGITYFDNVSISDTILGSSACDTILNYTITFTEFSTENIEIDLCKGDSVRINDVYYYESSTVLDTVYIEEGCGVINEIKINSLDLNEKNIEIQICKNDTITIDGLLIYEPGVYEVTIPSLNTCDSVYNYIIDWAPPLEINESTFLCKGDSLLIQGEIITEEGTYTIEYFNETGCDTVFIYDVALFPTQIDSVLHVLCQGDSIQLDDQVFYEDTILIDKAISNEGCNIDQIIEIIFESPSIIIDSFIKIDFGDSLMLTPQIVSSDDYIIIWESSDFNLNRLGNVQHFPVTNSGTIQINVITNSGCVDSFQVIIEVISPNCDESVFIPNAFSPNGDGINDLFNIFVAEECVTDVLEVKIFNRWGDLIYQDNQPTYNDFNNGWDGTFRGVDLQPDVFVYYVKVKFIDQRTEVISGDLLLKR